MRIVMRVILPLVLIAAAAAAAFWVVGRTPALDLDDLQPLAASTSTPADLSPFLDEVRARTGVPAIAAAMLSADGIYAVGQSGRSGADNAADLPEAAAWHVGSLTKNMTAVLAARLVEQGRMDWNTTPEDVWPDWPDEFDAAWRDVPLHSFLRMNAGVRRHQDSQAAFDRLAQSADRTANPVGQRREFLSAALALPPVSPPGETFHYVNDSYVMAAYMMEQLTGQAYESLMAEHVFTPLGLRSAGFGAPEAIWGHRPNGQPVRPAPEADNPAALSPAGRIHLSVQDYARYLQSLLGAARGETGFLSPGSVDILFAPFEGETESYAMGWTLRDDLGAANPVYAHTGSNTYWYADAWLVPGQDLAVFVFINQGGTGHVTDAVIWRLVRADIEQRLSAEAE